MKKGLQGTRRNVRTYHASEYGARLRVERGITQRELAEMAGIKERTVARIETEGIDCVRTINALAYCGALGITVEEAYFGRARAEE